MMRFVLTALILFFITSGAHARSVAFFWGGGGEPVSKTKTIFDSDFSAYVPLLLSKGWEVRSLFGVGHVDSEALVKKHLGVSAVPFTDSAVMLQLTQLMREASSGDVKRVLFIISSHGLEPEENYDRAHRVKATDPKGEDEISLQLLEPVRDHMEALSIPMSVLDFGCYSGATLELATTKTCVVSSSTSQEFSYNGFSRAFARLLEKGLNFEEAFLKARRNFDDFSGPEISTPENSVVKLLMAQNDLTQFPHKKAKYCSSCKIHQNLLTLFREQLPIQKDDLSERQRYDWQNLLRIRLESQTAVQRYQNQQIRFKDLDNVKSRTLIQFYFQERQFYEDLYLMVRDINPSACQSWSL